MVNFLPLPAYDAGKPVDFSPVYNALDSNARMSQQNNQFVARNKLAQAHLGLAQRRDDRDQRQFELAERAQKFKGMLGLANAAASEKDPTRRQQYLDRMLAIHPDGANVDPMYRDPVNGPRLILAEVANMGPQEFAQLGLIQANTAEAWAKARQAGQKSQFDTMLAQLLGGLANGPGPAPGASGASPPAGATPTPSNGPRLQPQSFAPGEQYAPQMIPAQYSGASPGPPMPSPPMSQPPRDTGTRGNLMPMPSQPINRLAQFSPAMGTGPADNALSPNMLGATGQPQSYAPNALMQPQSRDPNLIFTQGGGSPSPAAPSAPAVARPETYQTGLGPMTRERAERLGMGLALAGKGDAGKMLVDSIQRGEMGKEGRNKLDKDLIDTAQRYHRLQAIRSSMKPEYLEIPTRLGMQWKGIRAKFGTLPKGEQGELYKYATFRRDAAQELNELVKERSGGAVTPQEFVRQGVELPNAGNGIFDGDDPVTFQAKFDRAYEVVALGIARNAYLRKADARNAGATTAELARMMPVEQFREQVNQRARQIEGLVKQQNPELPDPIVNQEVDRIIKQEFGI